VMFNQRTDPYYIRLRELIRGGELGEIRRISWIITNWFRTAAYYASGGWRATWAGEGGGVLLNQSPHQLDLWQWLFGMPREVRAFCQIGRYHQIEVEDDVTAYFEYDNGTTGVFVTSTGEAPGTDRLEVAAENGRVIIENGRFLFTSNEVPMSEFSKTSPERFSQPKSHQAEIRFDHRGGQHTEVLQDFVDSIAAGRPPIAPGQDGIRSVELANAILFSSFTERTIRLPMDADAYKGFLEHKIAQSTFRKPVAPPVPLVDDFGKSFGK
jgi:predicted dehydrogenase